MDLELVAYLDKHFRETSRQIEGLRTEMVQEFAKVREEMAQGLASVREETAQGLASLRDELSGEIRLTRVEIESVRDEIRQVAEGVQGLSERLDSFEGEVKKDIAKLDRRVLRLEAERFKG